MIIYLQTLETPDDRSKFEQMYLEYRNLMFHVAYEILHNEQSAEDATHQAFVKIAENIQKIDEPVCPKTHGNQLDTCASVSLWDLRKCDCSCIGTVHLCTLPRCNSQRILCCGCQGLVGFSGTEGRNVRHI